MNYTANELSMEPPIIEPKKLIVDIITIYYFLSQNKLNSVTIFWYLKSGSIEKFPSSHVL